jgi:hypothetical protein
MSHPRVAPRTRSFDGTARVGHPWSQGDAPGAGSSTQRPAPAPHGRPGRSGPFAVERSIHHDMAGLPFEHPARKGSTSTCLAPPPSADPADPSRSRRARQTAGACAAASLATTVSTAPRTAAPPTWSWTGLPASPAVPSAGSAAAWCRRPRPGAPGSRVTSARGIVDGRRGRSVDKWSTGPESRGQVPLRGRGPPGDHLVSPNGPRKSDRGTAARRPGSSQGEPGSSQGEPPLPQGRHVIHRLTRRRQR